MIRAAALLVIVLAGCQRGEPAKSFDESLQDFQIKEAATHPVGRYQFIGKEVYPDGTVEYACLDTTNGSIGYAPIYTDPKKQSLNDFDCSN